MFKIILMSFVAFISYTALAQTVQQCGSLDIAEDKKYLTTKRSLCCEKSLLERLEDYRDQWQAGTAYPDPSDLFGSCNSTPTPTPNPNPNPNPNPTSVRVYHKECVCKYPKDTDVAFIPEYGTTGGTVLCCPKFDKIGEQNASSYSIETGSGYTQNEGPHTLECCKWHVWNYLIANNNGSGSSGKYSAETMKEMAIHARWMEGENDPATEKFCCLPGRRTDKSGGGEWIPQGIDGQGKQENGCCDKSYIFASKNCCETAFSDVQDSNGKPNTLFIDGGNPDDLSQNKCCSLSNYAFVESVFQYSDYEDGTQKAEVEQICCEADSGLFIAKGTSGATKALCCDKEGPYDKTDKSFPPKVSENCCKAYGGEVVSDSTDNPMPTEKEHCCDPYSPKELLSWDDTTGKATGAITETCCESMGGVYSSVTQSNGDVKGICCLGMSEWDETKNAWSTTDSLLCCKGAEEPMLSSDVADGMAQSYGFSERCCINDAKTNTNSKYVAAKGPNAEVCCVKGSSRQATADTSGPLPLPLPIETPTATCCELEASKRGVSVTWKSEQQICCLTESWVWKYADEVTGSGGMCTISESDTTD